jgi:hypothetical protein
VRRDPVVITVLVILALLTGVMSGGCSEVEGPQAVSPEQQLVERAEARWRALAEGDFEAAYAFESPAYRDITPLQRFRGQFGSAVAWKGAEVKRVELGESAATAKVLLNLRYSAHMPTGEPYETTQGVRENWMLADGVWWHIRK